MSYTYTGFASSRNPRPWCNAVLAMLILFTFVGPMLLASSASAHYELQTGSAVGLDERRASLLRHFRSAVGRWERERKLLEHVGSVRILIGEHAALNLSVIGEPTRLADSTAPGWTPLAFRGAVRTPIHVSDGWVHPFQPPVRLELRWQQKTVLVPLPPTDFTRTISTRSGSWKDCVNSKRGSYKPGWCMHFTSRASLCIAADLPTALTRGAGAAAAVVSASCDAGEAAAAAPATMLGIRSAAGGPRPGPTAAQGGHAAVAAAWRTAYPAHAKSGGSPERTALGPLVVTVRSSLDPLLAAHTLTNGSLHFGRSSAEEFRHANVVGLIGAIMCVPPAIAIVFFSLRAIFEWSQR